MKAKVGRVPFLGDDAIGCQAKNVESSIAYQAEVGRGSDGDAGVKERGVFDAVTVEALGAELEHCIESVDVEVGKWSKVRFLILSALYMDSGVS